MLGKLENILFLKNRKNFTRVNWLIILVLGKQTPFSEISQNFLTDRFDLSNQKLRSINHQKWIEKRMSTKSID
jgi:hypothetical protein